MGVIVSESHTTYRLEGEQPGVLGKDPFGMSGKVNLNITVSLGKEIRTKGNGWTDGVSLIYLTRYIAQPDVNYPNARILGSGH